MKRKSVLWMMVLLLVMSVVFAGCGKSDESTKKVDAPTKPIELTFWHAMGGSLGDAVNKLVDEFNKAHTDIHITAQFQGTYDDAINKLKSSVKGNAGPDIMQVYDIGTRFMIDSGYAVPMQTFIDSQKYDTSKLEPNLLGYYTVDKKLYSMPFNSSTPILYYNKKAFKEAGLDPEKAPKTFEEIQTMSKALTKKTGDKVDQYGFSIAAYGWFFEQLLVKQGMDYANNGNGRSDKATTVEFDKNGSGLKITQMWKSLLDSGNVIHLGRKTDDTKSAFIAGKVAMTLDSTSALKDIISGAGDRFEVGTAFLPSVDPTKDGGVSIGGASLWVMDKKDEAKQKAAFEFIKFMASPEQQAFWSQNTGYFPITTAAYELDSMKEYLKKKPQFQTAIDQLHASPKTAVGGLIAVFPQARQTIEKNLENMVQGTFTPEQVISESAKAINAAIDMYNKTNK